MLRPLFEFLLQRITRLKGARNARPHFASPRPRLLRADDRLRLRLRPALKGGSHDLRLFARRPRDRGADDLPRLRFA